MYVYVLPAVNGLDFFKKLPKQMNAFHQLFSVDKPLIAMIHVPALPGSPAYTDKDIVEQAVAEARMYLDMGVDGLLLENMHDTPYLRRLVGPETIAWMTAVSLAVKQAAGDVSCGIQILAGANKAALAVAQAAGLQYIRAEGFVYGHLADEGWMDADAGELLRYRRQIDAEDILVLTDIKKKHSAHSATADISLAETARAAAFFRTDGLIVTGQATGAATSVAEVRAVREACPSLPVLVGSGVDPDNLPQLLPYCDALIVGSYCKVDGYWANPLDPVRIKRMVSALSDGRRALAASSDGT